MLKSAKSLESYCTYNREEILNLRMVRRPRRISFVEGLDNAVPLDIPYIFCLSFGYLTLMPLMPSMARDSSNTDDTKMALTLSTSQTISNAVIAKSKELGLKPMAVAVYDKRGCLRSFLAQDGISLLRGEIAQGKAFGALALGMGSRAILKRAQEQVFFVDAVSTLAQGKIIPVPGGVLIRNENGTLVGAVGVSGDTSDNDEICAIAGVKEAGLVADPG